MNETTKLTSRLTLLTSCGISQQNQTVWRCSSSLPLKSCSLTGFRLELKEAKITQQIILRAWVEYHMVWKVWLNSNTFGNSFSDLSKPYTSYEQLVFEGDQVIGRNFVLICRSLGLSIVQYTLILNEQTAAPVCLTSRQQNVHRVVAVTEGKN